MMVSSTLSLKTLYLCYFGLREPLVQTQVLPYLRQLATDKIEVYILTFEPELRERWSAEQLKAQHEELAAEGIRWSYLPYHKRPTVPATLYDISVGARAASRLVREKGIHVLHARGHIAAIIGALAKRLSGAQLVFDVRSFMPEEYTDAGIWPEGGMIYRGAKRAERMCLKASDAFVVLTEKARAILFPGRTDTDSLGRPVEVIPCCVDLERFRAADRVSKEEMRRTLGLTNRRVIAYVGALGGWYLTNEMADFLAFAHRQDKSTFSMILTQSPPAMIEGRLRAAGVAAEDYLIRKVSPKEIPQYLKAADVALSFIKPCYSKLSSSPTKMAEYLASGLPVICNAGIGDVDEVVETDRVGVIIKELNEETYRQAIDAVEELLRDEGTGARCRQSAESRFDLETVGGERYRHLYRRLLEDRNKSLRFIEKNQATEIS
jgi:glycosyltransferase involved in cell wall biosynthesis